VGLLCPSYSRWRKTQGCAASQCKYRQVTSTALTAKRQQDIRQHKRRNCKNWHLLLSLCEHMQMLAQTHKDLPRPRLSARCIRAAGTP
jgi:hypothetical protein